MSKIYQIEVRTKEAFEAGLDEDFPLEPKQTFKLCEHCLRKRHPVDERFFSLEGDYPVDDHVLTAYFYDHAPYSACVNYDQVVNACIESEA